MRVRRFRGRKDLRAVIAHGLRRDYQGVSIRCRAGGARHHRVAVLCPKTVSRKAVERNRIRRIFFEAARLLLRNVPKPFDCAILVRPGFRYRAFTYRDAEAMISAIKAFTTRI